jgi:hypothetical protein
MMKPTEQPKAAHTVRVGDAVRLAGFAAHKTVISATREADGYIRLTFADYAARVRPYRQVKTI